MSLTISDVCDRMRVSRSTVLRMLKANQLAGVKKHSCGAICGDPMSCKQGAWEIPEAALKKVLG